MATNHEKLLGETLLKLLIKIGVSRKNACPTGPELVAIVEDYINVASQPAVEADAEGRCDYCQELFSIKHGVKCPECGVLIRTA